MPRQAAGLKLEAAGRIPLSQVVLEQLLGRLRDGALRPGDRLPSEHDLARALNVGRSSVREALHGLIALGLIETKPSRGAVVTQQARSPVANVRAKGPVIDRMQRSALLDLLEVRECLETQAAHLAAMRATPTDLTSIERHQLAIENRVAAGRSYFRPNTDFHTAIAEASHNHVLADSVRNLIVQVRESRERLMREVPGLPKRDIAEHRAILAAIRRRDADAAQAAMRAHIVNFVALLTAGDAVKRPDTDG